MTSFSSCVAVLSLIDLTGSELKFHRRIYYICNDASGSRIRIRIYFYKKDVIRIRFEHSHSGSLKSNNKKIRWILLGRTRFFFTFRSVLESIFIKGRIWIRIISFRFRDLVMPTYIRYTKNTVLTVHMVNVRLVLVQVFLHYYNQSENWFFS